MGNDNRKPPSLGTSEWVFEALDSFLDDPRVCALSAAKYRSWVGIVIVAARHGGFLPNAAEIAFEMRIRPQTAAKLVEEFLALGLIEDRGEGFLIPTVGERAPTINKSASTAVVAVVNLAAPIASAVKDPTAAERQRRCRERKRAAEMASLSEVETVTQDRDAVTRHDIDRDIIYIKSNISLPSHGVTVTRHAERPEPFRRFLEAFPDKGGGQNPEPYAFREWRRAIAAGADAARLVAAAKSYAAEVTGRENRFICSAANWLTQGRWREVASVPSTSPSTPAAPSQSPGVWLAAGSPGWDAWAQWWKANKGRTPPRDARDGWRFPAPMPPGVEQTAA